MSLVGAPAAPQGDLRYASARGRWVIAATVLGSSMAMIDSTAVGIALPTIGRQFHTGVADLQWVSNGYMLTLSGLLLLGGSLGDRHGRRLIFVVGTIWFAAASLLCGVAPSAGALIAARTLQGVGGALLTPGSLAILEASFARDDRMRAIGAWSGLGGVAAAIGPFLGGWLVSAVSWRLIFLVNLPVAVAVVALSLVHVPESRDEAATGPLDLRGAALVSAGLAGIVYGLIEGPVLGWTSAGPMTTLVAGAALLAAFVVVESRTEDPMLPPALFRSRQFTGANAVTLAVYGALGGALFLVPIELQQVVHYTPIAAGVSLLPITVVTLALSARSGELAQRIGPRLQMTVGPLLVGAGLALMARIGPQSGYLHGVLPGVAVLGLGLAVTVAPLTATVLAAAPARNSGIASAVNNDVARTASLIAVAVLPALSGITGDSYLHPTQFSSGFHTAVLIAACCCGAGALLSLLTIRNPDRRRAAPCRWHCAVDAPPLSEVRATSP
jgi:EmrB/QacA subfamily drug resistance transporter